MYGTAAPTSPRGRVSLAPLTLAPAKAPLQLDLGGDDGRVYFRQLE